VFTENMAGIDWLAFLLTADPKKAEECFVGGLGDCLEESSVFRDGAQSWARRTIIQNAFECWHLVRTTRRLQKHRVIPSVAALDARRRPVTQSGASCALKHSSALFLSCPFLLRSPGVARSRTSVRQECERYCMPPSLPGNVPRSGRGLIPKITKKPAARETQMESQFLVPTRTGEGPSL
jgi:hypothetical protein